MTEVPTVRIDTLRLAGVAGAGALALARLGVGLRSGTDPRVWILVGVLAVAAGVAAWGLGKAPCPQCGFLRSGVRLRNNRSLHCQGCGAYFRTKAGVCVETGVDAIEPEPVFAAECPRAIQWPSGCCVCAGTVEQAVVVSLTLDEDAPIAQDLMVRAATLGTFNMVSKRRYEANVPVCNQHASDGHEPARLDWNLETAQLTIKFRSRRYAEAFAATNGPVFWDD